MARAIVWPRIASEAEIPPAAEAALNIDLSAFSAALGPELTRLMGIRISAGGPRLDRQALAQENLLLLGRIALPLTAGAPALLLGCPAADAAMLLERLFGARGSDASSASAELVCKLPPGSASWAALCRTLCAGAVRALQRADLRPSGSPALSPRPTALLAGSSTVALGLDVDGSAGALLLVPEAAPPAPEPDTPAPDPREWRRRAEARAFDLDLPVSLRIAERRLPLEALSSLRAGDILPIDQPRTIDVLASGRRIARLPASRFRSLLAPEEGE